MENHFTNSPSQVHTYYTSDGESVHSPVLSFYPFIFSKELVKHIHLIVNRRVQCPT